MLKSILKKKYHSNTVCTYGPQRQKVDGCGLRGTVASSTYAAARDKYCIVAHHITRVYNHMALYNYNNYYYCYYYMSTKHPTV